MDTAEVSCASLVDIERDVCKLPVVAGAPLLAVMAACREEEEDIIALFIATPAGVVDLLRSLAVSSP